MNVLIAGGSGLIGSAIIDHILTTPNQGYNYDFGDKADFDAKRPLSDYIGGTEKRKHPFTAFIDCSWPKDPADHIVMWNDVIEHFKSQQGGKMILFSSIYGHKAPDFGMYEGTEIQAKPIEYAMLKAATEQATRYLAQRLKPWGIQVNCIAPGGVLNKESECFQREYANAYNAPMIETKNILPIIDALLHTDNALNGQVIHIDFGAAL